MKLKKLKIVSKYKEKENYALRIIDTSSSKYEIDEDKDQDSPEISFIK